MNYINYINDVFLYVLSIDKNTILTKIDFKHIDLKYLKYNDRFNSTVNIMRHNFGKFWNIIGKKNEYKLIELVFKDLNMDSKVDSKVDSNLIQESTRNDFIGNIYNLIDKLIKYADNIDMLNHVIKFYTLSDEYAKNMIDNSKTSLSCYDDKNELFNLRHNFIMFWLGLTNERKYKFVELVDNFFSSINSNQFDIIFNENTNKYIKITIDYFNGCNKNVIIVTNYDEYINTITEHINYYSNILSIDDELSESNVNIKNNNKILIDTIFFQNIDISKHNFENLPLWITKIKFKHCGIKLLDWLHDGIEVLDCSSNSIEQLDNLPMSIKILICSDNKLKSLNNLPLGLEYLDCSGNCIEQLDNLPKSLIYLKCNFNKIESIDNLPNSLFELDCSKNLIENYNKFPENLVSLNIKNNKLTRINNLPYGLKILNINNNRINNIYSINSSVEKLIMNDSYYSPIELFDLPNSLIELSGSYKSNTQIKNLYEKLINNVYI